MDNLFDLVRIENELKKTFKRKVDLGIFSSITPYIIEDIKKRCELFIKKDKAYLKHIVYVISNIEKFTESVSEEEFLRNLEKQYTVIRGLEIIGKATKNLSRELKSKWPEIPWKNIVSMKDKLIHGYFGVDLKLVW